MSGTENKDENLITEHKAALAGRWFVVMEVIEGRRTPNRVGRVVGMIEESIYLCNYLDWLLGWTGSSILVRLETMLVQEWLFFIDEDDVRAHLLNYGLGETL